MFAHYLTVAWRNLVRTPGATAVNILTLALGLACFVTAAAVVDYWNKSERYFDNADRVAVISTSFAAIDGSFATGAIPFTALHLADYLKADFPGLEHVARVIPVQETGIANADRSVGVFRLIAEPEFLEIFDLPFLSGDVNSSLDQPSSVVLTQEIATQLFGDQDPMGQPVIIAGIVDATVTGIVARVPDPSHLGEAESSPLSFDIIASWDTWEAIQRVRGRSWPLPEDWALINTITYALLPTDGSLTVNSFTTQLETFAERHIPPENVPFATLEISAIPVVNVMTSYLNGLVLGGAMLDGGAITVPRLLLLLGGLILGIACLNFANLATTRAAGRAREIGMRKTVGASRSEVILQYLFEAAVLTACAVAIAAATLAMTVPVVRNTVDIDLTASLFVGVNFWVSLIALIVIVAVAAGSYPAFVLSAVRPVTALRLGRSKSGSRLDGKVLVAAQFVASSFLLIAVIVMLSQNRELRRTGLGTGSDPSRRDRQSVSIERCRAADAETGAPEPPAGHRSDGGCESAVEPGFRSERIEPFAGGRRADLDGIEQLCRRRLFLGIRRGTPGGARLRSRSQRGRRADRRTGDRRTSQHHRGQRVRDGGWLRVAARRNR